MDTAAVEDDVEDDGDSDDGSDGVDGDDPIAAIDAEQGAQQRHVGPGNDGHGDETAVVAGGEHQPGDVRHHQAQEADGTAECGHHSGEHAGDE